MENKKIIDYVMQSPNNTNPAVLESMLEAIIGGGGTSGGGAFYMSALSNDEELIGGWLYKITDHQLTADEFKSCLVVVETPTVGSTSFFSLENVDDADDAVFEEDGMVALVIGSLQIYVFNDVVAAEMGVSVGTYLAVYNPHEPGTRVVKNCALIWK